MPSDFKEEIKKDDYDTTRDRRVQIRNLLNPTDSGSYPSSSGTSQAQTTQPQTNGLLKGKGIDRSEHPNYPPEY